MECQLREHRKKLTTDLACVRMPLSFIDPAIVCIILHLRRDMRMSQGKRVSMCSSKLSCIACVLTPKITCIDVAVVFVTVGWMECFCNRTLSSAEYSAFTVLPTQHLDSLE